MSSPVAAQDRRGDRIDRDSSDTSDCGPLVHAVFPPAWTRRRLVFGSTTELAAGPAQLTPGRFVFSG